MWMIYALTVLDNTQEVKSVEEEVKRHHSTSIDKSYLIYSHKQTMKKHL